MVVDWFKVLQMQVTIKSKCDRQYNKHQDQFKLGDEPLQFMLKCAVLFLTSSVM